MSLPLRAVKFGVFAFDYRAQELRKNGFKVKMPALQIRLLALFLERPGELVTRDDIESRLWTSTATIDAARNINTVIMRLRVCLHDDPADPVYIETVIGLGYRFIAPVVAVPLAEPRREIALPPASLETATVPLAVSSARSEGQVAGDPPSAAIPVRKVIWTGAVAVVLAAGWLTWMRRPATQPPLPVAPQPATFEPATFDYGTNKVTAAAVSPDGATLAYADNAGISLHHFEGGADTALNSERGQVIQHLAWLPNAPTLLVSCIDVPSGKPQVWLVGADGYFHIDLADASAAEPSPDGASIAFTRRQGRELWVATVQGDNPHLLPAVSGEEVLKFVLWSRDGHYLLLSGYLASKQWFYRTVEAGSGRVLTNKPGVAIDSGFLLPDGSLHFVNEANPVGIVNKSHSAEMKVNTQAATGSLLGTPVVAEEIPSHPAISLSASRDGSRQAVVLQKDALDVYVAQVTEDGASLKHTVQLSHGVFDAYPHAWTTDGSVLFERLLNGKSAIYAQGPGEPRLIASMAVNLFCPRMSPDGQWILFMAAGQQGNSLYRVPIAGGSPEAVPGARPLEDFSCPIKPGASCIISRSLGRKAMAYHALDGVSGVGRELARTPWRPAHLGAWNVSPDGELIAVADDSSTNPGLDLIPLDTKAAARRFLPVRGQGTVLEATWSADGKALYVECRTDRGFSLIYKKVADYAVAGGQDRVIATSPSLLYAVPSPDGKRLALPLLGLTTNVWTKVVR